MFNPPASSEAESAADHAAEDSLFHREVLNELIGLGSDLARMIHGQAKDQAAARYADEGVPDVTVAFERVCQTVRRTILLCRKVGEGLPMRAEARSAARPETVRAVASSAEPTAARDTAGLRCELGDRMERPECEDALPERPVGEIIVEIRGELEVCRDEIGGEMGSGAVQRPPGRPGGDPSPSPSGSDPPPGADPPRPGGLAGRLCGR
jgi:hypothetical protein